MLLTGPGGGEAGRWQCHGEQPHCELCWQTEWCWRTGCQDTPACSYRREAVPLWAVWEDIYSRGLSQDTPTCHTGKKSYHCDQCGKNFSEQCSYRREALPLSPLWNKVFSYPAALKKHQCCGENQDDVPAHPASQRKTVVSPLYTTVRSGQVIPSIVIGLKAFYGQYTAHQSSDLQRCSRMFLFETQGSQKCNRIFMQTTTFLG